MKGVWERTHCPAESAWASGGGGRGEGGEWSPPPAPPHSPSFPGLTPRFLLGLNLCHFKSFPILPFQPTP